MQIELDDLFTGEEVIVSKNANAIITLNEYALKAVPMADEKALQLIGYAGKDEIGGKLHVTNYRLIFKSHPLNRAKGKFSIFLDTIRDAKSAVNFAKRIEIGTLSQDYELAVWGIPEFLQQINAARDAFAPMQLPELKKKIETESTKIGNGFEKAVGMGFFAHPMGDTKEIVSTPFGFSNLLNVMELLKIAG